MKIPTDAVAADGAASDGAVAWLRRFIGTAGHLLAGHPDEASLAASLRLGRPVLERGVLAAADGGVLIAAMAERSPKANIFA